MKILQINTFDSRGGAAKFCSRLKKFLDKQKIANWLITKSKEGSSNLKFKKSFFQKVLHKILRTEGLGKNILSELKKLPFWNEIDLIHFHNLHGGYFNIFNLSKISRSKKCIWTLHDPWIIDKKNILVPEYKNIFKHENKVFNKFKKNIIKKSDIVLISPSIWLKEKIKKEYPNKEIEIIPNGVNSEIFKPLNKKEARGILKIPKDKKVILFVANGGKDNLEKGSEYINLIKKHFSGTLFIELGENSKYISNESEMALYYSSADLLLFPSLAENFPLSILESMSCETPVVAFNTGGIKEIIDHKINGYISEYKSLEDLIEGINFILKNDTMAIKAREKILKHFDEKIIFNKYLEIYKKILN